MSAERDKRKLSAVLSAAVKGYSRLMGEDEESTIRTLGVYCRARDHRSSSGGTHQRYGGETVEGLRHHFREFSCSGAK